MDRQSSGPLRNIPVAGRDYEEGEEHRRWIGYRLFRGGEGRKTLALLGWRLESRALGYGIAHGVGRTMDALSEYPDVALGCAGVSGTTSSMAYNGCFQ